MTTATHVAADRTAAVSTKTSRTTWIGRGISALPVLMLLMSAGMKLSHAPDFVAQWTDKLGWPVERLTAIAVLELAVTALYVFPRTAVLGAVFLSAYLGGAVATHVRVGDPFVIPILLGVAAWVGIYLRDDRLREVAPLRRPRRD